MTAIRIRYPAQMFSRTALQKLRREVFEPEDLARMTRAYDAAYAELAGGSVRFEPLALARLIISLARIVDLDAAQIAESAVNQIRKRASCLSSLATVR